MRLRMAHPDPNGVGQFITSLEDAHGVTVETVHYTAETARDHLVP